MMTILVHTKSLRLLCLKVLLHGLLRPKVRRLRRLVRLLAQARSEVARLDGPAHTILLNVNLNVNANANGDTISRNAGTTNLSEGMSSRSVDMIVVTISRSAGMNNRGPDSMSARGPRRVRTVEAV